MRPEQALCKAAGAKQRVAQQHRIAQALPDGHGDIIPHGDILHQHRVDADADHNEKRLEAQGQQGLQIVLPRLAPLPVGHRGKGDRPHGYGQIHLDHSSVDHKEDGDGEDMGAEAHKNALKPQAQQRTDAPIRQGRFQIADHAGNIDPRVGDDDAGALTDHALRHIEYRHDDVPSVGDDEHRAEGLEDPLPEKPGVKIVEIILFHDELDQLIAHDEGEDDAGDGDDDRFREAADHVEDAAVPAGRRHAHLAGDLAHLRIHGVKGPGEVGDDAVDQQLLEPLLDHFNYHGWSHLLSGAPAVKREPPGGMVLPPLSQAGRTAGGSGSRRSGRRRRPRQAA